MATRRVVRIASFQATIKGVDVFVSEGSVYSATNPVVKGREELFKPVSGEARQ